MNRLKSAAILLPFLSAVALCLLRVADWGGQHPNGDPSELWRAFVWLLLPFALAGFPLMLLQMIVSINLQPVVSALIEPKEIVLLVLGFLFTLYLLLRGRSVMAGDLWRASCAGTAVFICIGLASAVMIRGMVDDEQASLALVIGQNGGLVAGLLLVEVLLRFRRQSAAN